MPINDQKQLASAILVAGVLIAGAILLKGSAVPRNNLANNGSNGVLAELKIKPVSRDEHILGNPNAKVVVVEYSDTECPFCKQFHNTMHQIIREKGDDVAWVYRHYPIPALHPKAFHEAEATECAWEQGGNDAFWKYTDEVYVRTESNNRLDVAELPKIAEALWLNVTSFNECLASGKFKTKVQADIDSGSEIGVNGTPSSYILKNGKNVPFIDANGKQYNNIPGAQPLNIVMQNLERILK